jgi:hypothetical protein
MSHSGFRPPAGIGGAHSCGKSPNRAAPNEPGCLPGSCSVHRWPECDIVKAVNRVLHQPFRSGTGATSGSINLPSWTIFRDDTEKDIV